MEREIKELLNKHILKEAALKYDFDVSNLGLLGDFQNFVYEYKKHGKSYILRMTHSSHRSEQLIRGELDYLMYLTQNGAPVSKPVYSKDGKLTERINAGNTYFTAVVFEKAFGRKVGYPECISNDRLFEVCGEFTGKMHRLSKAYIPSSEGIKRFDWTENYYIKNIRRFIPRDQQGVFDSCEKLIKKIGILSRDTGFGLIHGDINVGNFLMDGDKIIVFDFDECQYSWFVEDIAIQLFYIIYVFLNDSIDDRVSQAKRFMRNFMKGYNRENLIDEEWIKQIPVFLQLREIIVYIGMHRSLDISNLSEWRKDYLMQSRYRIENGIPIIKEISIK